ncbi:ribonuclease P protein component [Ectothiorhodospiraceae bacterium 2226]|nr:ribonuclease P protein component [Ectothiorhodospiraceae bacterium 2226]
MPTGGAGFGRCRRLLNPAEYRRVFEAPCRRSRDGLTVLARPNGLDRARLGLAVSKRQLKHAVARNRIKRLARESFRHHQAELVGWDVVVSARASAEQADNSLLRAAFARLWADVAERCKRS